MTAGSIVKYSLSALVFAGLISVLWWVQRGLRGKRTDNRAREILYLLTVAYLAALIQITALRLGLVSPHWLNGHLRPIPFETTLAQARAGVWPFMYHTVGNMLWFIPLGGLLPALSQRFRIGKILLMAALLSLSIECMQFLLGTGVSDIDDVILNALGALAGYGIYRLLWRVRHAKGHKPS